MDFVKSIYGQRMQLLSFALSILVVTGTFFVGWLLTVLSPIFVFLIFKFLKVWKSRERIGYGIPAIVIGTVLFFFIFSHQVANVDVQEFGMGNMIVRVHGYASTDFSKVAEIDVTYSQPTNSSLYYEVNRTFDGENVASGYVNGTLEDNKTHYHFTVHVTEGIYFVKIVVNKDVVYGEIIRETPDKLFQYFLQYSGVYIMAILSLLYGLFIFGVHILRRSQDMMRLRYEQEK